LGDAGISSAWQAQIFAVMNQFEPAVFFQKLFKNRCGIIAGFVIDADDFEIGKTLGNNGFEALAKIRFYIVYGYNDGNR